MMAALCWFLAFCLWLTRFFWVLGQGGSAWALASNALLVAISGGLALYWFRRSGVHVNPWWAE